MTPTRWNAWVALLHWFSALLIVGLIALGFAMTRFFDAATRFDLYQQHKAFGVLAMAVVVLRLGARAATTAPAPLPGPDWEHRAAKVAHVSLYALSAVVVLAGWATASTSPLPVPTVVFGLFALPALVGPNAAAFAVVSWLHAAAAYALAALVALHAAAALKHAFIDRDATLRRMSPFGRA